ncbi:hypothetical protein A8C56_05130 [Niabella ginsenosidivorans]|uniref:Asl1-like glycosyl hydrolase catalytic domain-containing protein n=1 Tax=Niabella ginsenosidivorans TaxID=1176587 RepID=A0A1A9HZE7_9BACT|nr:hypothetical protein [Niabella ginsenosidivorans]ANH80455.1 hypothetical protein A8C56_05130 [Niabella ginsenosidivorans]
MNYKQLASVSGLALYLLFSCGKSKGQEHQYESGLVGKIIDSTHPITMDAFIGANAFIDDPPEKLKPVGFIREYHDWDWNEGNRSGNYPGFPYNQIRFAPSYPGWSFDDFYQVLKNENITVSPCLQGAAGWLHGGNDFPKDNKPIDSPGLDPADPFSYYKKAFFAYQLAARYGTVKVPDSSLALAPDQPRLSGMGLIGYIEDWNEQDRDWEGKDAEFSPQEYAAMASADYDGHCNTMNKYGKKYGIKNADPSAKLVMGGLVNTNLEYIKRMKTWFEANRRDKVFAADVLNFHIYAFKDGKSWQGGGPAISPEDAHFRERLSEIVKYRNQYLPQKEVWVSEFGWDTNPQSVLCPPQIGNMDAQEVQGIWLVRAYLAFAAAGVDRAQMFMSRDVNPNDKTWFSSSGLMGPKGDFTPKKSWYYVHTLKNVLQHMRYMGNQDTKDPNVLIYKFKDISSSKGAYVVWARTSRDYKAADFQVPVSSDTKEARLITLLPGNAEGDTQNLTINKGSVYIDVSEKPVFIAVDNIK